MAILVVLMQSQQHLCSDCGEPIDAKRLLALPTAQQCVSCASQATVAAIAIAPPKPIAAKPIATTTYHLKRYLTNVGQKTEPQALFRTLVRLNYLFPGVSAAEMTPIIIDWSKRTSSRFDQEQIRKLVLEARQWAQEHPNRMR
ncbi:MAG: TraR/DksA family transcriptional regulator [Myxococcales bacterium]